MSPVPRPRTGVLAAFAAASALLVAIAGVVGLAHARGAEADPVVKAAAGGTPRPSELRVQRSARVDDVASLRKLTAPDAVVALHRIAGPHQLHRLRHAHGIRQVAVLDVGTVHVRHQKLMAIGVDAGHLRSFTPSLTARSDALWQSVARGELTLAYARAHHFRHRLGSDVVTRGRHGAKVPLRLGAFASIGIGHAEALVSHRTARALDLRPAHQLVIHAPKLPASSLAWRVHHIFGSSVTVHDVRPHTVNQHVMSDYARATIPAAFLSLYRAAAATCQGLPWTVLAGIGAVETHHGADTRVSRKGAMGPMQFLPSTFAAYAVDADGDGYADINNPTDAVYSAARYLCLWGAGRGGQSLYDAVFAYNHADWYVRLVFTYANAYA